MESTCRTCLNKINVNLLPLKINVLEDKKVKFFLKLIGINVSENDRLPLNICLTCKDEISKIIIFFEMCKKTDYLLRTQSNEFSEVKSSKNLNKLSKPVTYDKLQTESSSFLKIKESNNYCKLCYKRITKKSTSVEHNKWFLNEHYQHKNSLQCEINDKGFLTKQKFKKHTLTHSKMKTKQLSCPECKKLFKYQSSMSEHMKSHNETRPYLCSICGKSFKQIGTLHYHQKLHSGEKPFSCDICSENFVSRAVLKVHIRKHTNEKPFSCDQCNKSFRQSTDLKSHLRIHAGIKTAECPVCQKKISTTGQLTVHLRTHTGEKPFKCSTCSKSFTTNSILVKHNRTHSGERPYVCNICGKSFSQNGSMKRHMKTHVSEKKVTKLATTKVGKVYKTLCSNIKLI